MRPLLLCSALLVACAGGESLPKLASDGTPLVEGFDPPPPPADAVQIVSPILTNIAPGDNIEYCYYSKYILREKTPFRAGQGFQAPGGHHVVAYWRADPQPETTHPCTEDDMLKMHVLSGGGAEAGNGIINGLPEGTAFHVPAGAQIILNVHVLNASPKPIDSQAVVNLYRADPSLQPISSFYVTGTDLTIPVGESKSYHTSCPAKYPMKVVRLLGHMHEWGTRSQITITRPTLPPDPVYDKPGSPEFSYNPPALDFPISAPLQINAGDVIGATCTWKNTTDHALSFPDEMCAAFGYILGSDPEHGCSDGAWNN